MNYSEAIIHHYGFNIANFHYDMSGKLHWEGPGEEPTIQELERWENERLDFVSKNSYIKDRLSEYPPIKDQLDYIYHQGVEAWKTDIVKPVKDKYPKPQ